MHPEFSIIILTVLAGVGEGLFFLIVGGDFIDYVGGEALSREALIVGVIGAIGLTSLGLAASFFHLARKERARKAFKMWRSSWLAREAALAPLFLIFATLYGAGKYFDLDQSTGLIVGAIGAIAGIALGVASGMIYQSTRYIKEWANPYTPINFIMVGFAPGSVALLAIFDFFGASNIVTLNLTRIAIGLTLIGFILKLTSFRFNDSIYEPLDVNSALGARLGAIRQIDSGAAYETYNTREYFHARGKALVKPVRIGCSLALFIVPIGALGLNFISLSVFDAPIRHIGAALFPLMLSGALAERWLFFVEGNHTQNLFYGNFKPRSAPNPITTPAKNLAPRD